MTEPYGDKAGTALIYTPFWPQKIEIGKAKQSKAKQSKAKDIIPEPDLVHPLLVYADLIATGDSRSREVAGKIYDEYIVKFS